MADDDDDSDRVIPWTALAGSQSKKKFHSAVSYTLQFTHSLHFDVGLSVNLKRGIQNIHYLS
jgi:hypothetical protein